MVSIHAPHVGRDLGSQNWRQQQVVSIHAPHVGRDIDGDLGWEPEAVFQSTRPTWGATTTVTDKASVDTVSIHAPHVGRDPVAMPSKA